MSLCVEDIRTRVAQFYPNVKQLDKNLLCFSKLAPNNAPFAVYYLDVAEALPATEAEVRRYVEQAMGSRYFEGKPSLQWNNYLYFVREAQALRERAAQTAINVIERDRTYARKFVIDEQGLDALLRPSVTRPDDTTGQVDVASQWIAALKQPHLIEAVFGQYPLAQRLQLADGTKSPPKQQPGKKTAALERGKLLPPIRNFTIEAYRPCLQSRSFVFTDVNLLVGVNGSGKTSLLEAIELYYCGKRTKRNPKIAERYHFGVQLRGGKVEAIMDERPESVFRDRNLMWYGVREQKRSYLFDSFCRFNFLNTDAAVDLARAEDEDVERHLAQLLIGSEAAAVWDILGDLAREVDAELRRDGDLKSQVDQEIEIIQQQLAESGRVKRESDSLRTALQDALRRNDWRVDGHDLEDTAGLLVEQLSELRSVAQQAVQLPWLDSPVTLDICNGFVAAVQRVIAAHKPQVQQLESLEARQAQLTAHRVRNEEAAVLVAELGRLVEAGVERRATELAAQRAAVTKATDLLAGIDQQLLEVANALPGNLPVAEIHDSAVRARKGLEVSLREAKGESEKFARVRERSVALAQQLRRLAADIIGDGPADECPLCHTRFGPGELASHMAMGVDEHVEAAAQKLLEDVARLEKELREAETIETVVNRIVRFRTSARLPEELSFEDALSRIITTQAESNDARSRVAALTSAVRSLQAEGLSRERLNEIRSKLSALGFSGTLQSPNEISALHSTIEEQMRASSVEMESAAETMEQIRATMRAAFRPFRPSAGDPRSALAELEERRITTEAIHSRLMQFLPRFGWPASRPLAEWIVEAETVGNIAAKLQTALGLERVAASRYSETLHRKEKLGVETKRLADRIARCKEAAAAFKEIQTKHSLGIVTRAALEKNRAGIEDIFAQIHSPAEFAGIEVDEKGWRVTRKGSDEKVPLTRVSTGQRAAFALSVFLAQNAQLREGPPVILIDDPIAHVDDLNCLSFLDYLRKVALSGTRQIFFATAGDKLASLFERKFDFLGDKFRRFDLTRNGS